MRGGAKPPGTGAGEGSRAFSGTARSPAGAEGGGRPLRPRRRLTIAAAGAEESGRSPRTPAPLPAGEAGGAGAAPPRDPRHTGDRSETNDRRPRRRTTTEPPTLTAEALDRDMTGVASDPAAWAASRRASEELDAQTAEMAGKLEAEGIGPWRADRRGAKVMLVGAVTGEQREMVPYRELRFLPSVAKRERAPMLRTLTYFQRHHRLGPYLRFAVVTTGARVPFGGDLRGTIAALHRRISRWASEANTRFNIAVVFRCTEFTVDAALTFHPHANVLYAPRALLPAAQWAEFLSWSGEFLGAHWEDNGVLNKPEEALKYAFKPADTARLTAPQLAWLFHQLPRLKLAQPMGEFASLAKQLECKGERIRAVRNRSGGAGLCRVAVRQRDRAARAKTAIPTKDGENVILAHTAPAAMACPFAEPGLLVRNYTAQPVTEAGRRGLAMILERQAQARRHWDANGAPSPEKAMENHSSEAVQRLR